MGKFAGNAKACPLVQQQVFTIDPEFQSTGKNQSGLFTFVGIELRAGTAAGLDVGNEGLQGPLGFEREKLRVHPLMSKQQQPP